MLELRCLSLAARGLYAELLRLPSHFRAPLPALARLVGSTVRELKRLFGELVAVGLAAFDGARWQILPPAPVERSKSTERVKKHRMKRNGTPVETPDETRETPSETEEPPWETPWKPDATPPGTPPKRPASGFERVSDIYARAASLAELASEKLSEKQEAAAELASLASNSENEKKPESEIPKKPPGTMNDPERGTTEHELLQFVERLVPQLGPPHPELAGDLLRQSPTGLKGVLEAFRHSGIERRIKAGMRIDSFGFFVTIVRGHFARARAS